MLTAKLKNKCNPSAENEDPFVKLLGDSGRWQFLVFASASIVKLSFGWIQMAILFLTPNLTYRCVNLPNSTEELLNNTCYENCLNDEYDTTPFDNTIVSEWDLVCERRWLASFTQTMLQFGVLIGSIVFGFLSDRWVDITEYSQRPSLSYCYKLYFLNSVKHYHTIFWTTLKLSVQNKHKYSNYKVVLSWWRSSWDKSLKSLSIIT